VIQGSPCTGHLSKPRETRLQRANQDRPIGYLIEWRRGVPPSGPTRSRRCATSRSLNQGADLWQGEHHARIVPL
jgi:hypothetical protein